MKVIKRTKTMLVTDEEYAAYEKWVQSIDFLMWRRIQKRSQSVADRMNDLCHRGKDLGKEFCVLEDEAEFLKEITDPTQEEELLIVILEAESGDD